MFDFENNKKNKPLPGHYGFVLEDKIAKDSKFATHLSQKIDDRILKIKDLLRKGTRKEDFNAIATILNGYIALQKVLKRVEAQNLLRRRQG
jgi:hypothetical protein